MVAEWSLAALKNLTLLHNWLIFFNLKSVFSPQRVSLWEFFVHFNDFQQIFLKSKEKIDSGHSVVAYGSVETYPAASALGYSAPEASGYEGSARSSSYDQVKNFVFPNLSSLPG